MRTSRSLASLGMASAKRRLSRSGDFGAFVVCGFGAALDQMHGLEDGLDDGFISHGRVYHYVVERAGGPVGVEGVFYVGDALTVDGIVQVFGFRSGGPILQQAAYFFGAGRIEKNVERVRM